MLDIKELTIDQHKNAERQENGLMYEKISLLLF